MSRELTRKEMMERNEKLQRELETKYNTTLEFKKSGKFVDQLAVLNEILKSKPDSVAALRAKADAHSQLGQQQEAIEALKTAQTVLEIYPPRKAELTSVTDLLKKHGVLARPAATAVDRDNKLELENAMRLT